MQYEQRFQPALPAELPGDIRIAQRGFKRKLRSRSALDSLPLPHWLVNLAHGHIVCDLAETLDSGGVFCLGALGRTQHDDAHR